MIHWLMLCTYIPPCSEESSAIPGVGVEKLVEVGKLDFLKNGPLFWVDSADSQPCMGISLVIYTISIVSLSRNGILKYAQSANTKVILVQIVFVYAHYVTCTVRQVLCTFLVPSFLLCNLACVWHFRYCISSDVDSPC